MTTLCSATERVLSCHHLYRLIQDFTGQCTPEVVVGGPSTDSSPVLFVRFPGRHYVLWTSGRTQLQPRPEWRRIHRIHELYGGLIMEAAGDGRVSLAVGADLEQAGSVWASPRRAAPPPEVASFLRAGLRSVVKIPNGIRVTNGLGATVALYCNGRTFLSLGPSGPVAWGDGPHPTTETVRELARCRVVDVYPGTNGFLVKTDIGRIVEWGSPSTSQWPNRDGRPAARDYSSVARDLQQGVDAVYTTMRNSFVALKKGSAPLIAWGVKYAGGVLPEELREKKREAVVAIASTQAAFAALMADGTVVTWGDVSGGGDSEPVQPRLRNVVEIVGYRKTFVAILQGRREIVVWGAKTDIPDTARAEIDAHGIDRVHIHGFCGPAVARLLNGKVISLDTASLLDVADSVSDVSEIVRAPGDTFLLVKREGGVVLWGGFPGVMGDHVQSRLNDEHAACVQSLAYTQSTLLDALGMTPGARPLKRGRGAQPKIHTVSGAKKIKSCLMYILM